MNFIISLGHVLLEKRFMSLCLDLCGSLVSILSGHCPVHQLAPQFVLFGFVWVPKWYLEWALFDPP